MSQTRRLAAILAADVAGYSRMMGADAPIAGARWVDRTGRIVDGPFHRPAAGGRTGCSGNGFGG